MPAIERTQSKRSGYEGCATGQSSVQFIDRTDSWSWNHGSTITQAIGMAGFGLVLLKAHTI
ncbi:MAG: hypothetical protein ACKO8F_08485 [Acidimicrobiaceae bacterium]